MTVPSNHSSSYIQFKKDLERLARLAANMVEAHSSVIFMPSRTVAQLNGASPTADTLIPCAAHTLAPQQLHLKDLSSDHGLIGWVAKNRKSIHVSPFERDSRILGIYTADLQLKSCLGVPITVDTRNQGTAGVLLVDSKKAFAFSKIQGKLLEDLGEEVTALLRLYGSEQKSAEGSTLNWDSFLAKGKSYASAVGFDSIAVLRIRTTNFGDVERQLGLASATKYLDQLYRLVGQALPPHYPTFITPTGELLTVIDSMMTDVYTNKILAISEHPSLRPDAKNGLTLEFRARSFGRSETGSNLEALINLTTFHSELTKAQAEPVAIEEPRRRIFQFR